MPVPCAPLPSMLSRMRLPRDFRHGESLAACGPPACAPEDSEPQAMLVECSAGVRIVRQSGALYAGAGDVLLCGDRVIVPTGGGAQAVFHEQAEQAVMGRFEAGCNAALVYFSRKGGACSVVFDVLDGRVGLFLSTIRQNALPGGRPGRAERTVVGLHCYFRPVIGGQAAGPQAVRSSMEGKTTPSW